MRDSDRLIFFSLDVSDNEYRALIHESWALRRFKLVTAAGLLEWTSNDVWHVAATLFVWFGDATGSERISSSGVIVDLAGVWQRKMWAFYK